ncbi:MAG: parallel beta-helix domain-containing protein [Pseudomonadota bacterium]
MKRSALISFRRHRHPWRGVAAAVFGLLLTGCGDNGAATTESTAAPASVEATLRAQFENAKPGDVIEVPEGTHSIRRPLILKTDNVTVRGAGMDRSILSFAGQLAGGEGVLVNASNFVIEDLAIEDSIGDALKISDGENITIRRVRTEWTNGPDTENGAYGIYPVQTRNTLIEGAIAIGASDAGIYVGQSDQVIVRNCKAAYNVAGIEIENTVHADVYENVAEHNTGGILVFNMPDLPMAGHSTRVYNNEIRNNNTDNFAAPGTAVSGVPAGSGLVVNSNDLVEIFDNDFEGHRTAHIVLSSYFSANYAGQQETAEAFDPYPEQILIAGNRYGKGGYEPALPPLEAARNTLFGADGTLPAIVWDGIVAEGRSARICVQDEVDVLNADTANDFANPGTAMAEHRCELPRLPAVSLGR